MTETFLCVLGGSTKCKVEHETTGVFSNGAAVNAGEWAAVPAPFWAALLRMCSHARSVEGRLLSHFLALGWRWPHEYHDAQNIWIGTGFEWGQLQAGFSKWTPEYSINDHMEARCPPPTALQTPPDLSSCNGYKKNHMINSFSDAGAHISCDWPRSSFRRHKPVRHSPTVRAGDCLP